jgi:tetrathionate reductase subunit A
MTDKSLTPVAETQPESCGLSRRDFLKMAAVSAGAGAVLGTLPAFDKLLAAAEGASAYTLAEVENQIRTVCLQCNTGCGIKVKLLNGVAAKIDGNPYSPWTMQPHIPYETPVAETGTIDGSICPKGQAGLQTAYDPYRLVSVLKRKPGTQRGAGQWVTIPFEQAIQEIVEGGDLFGEGSVEGLKALYALRDPKVAKAMSEAVVKILDEKDPDRKKILAAEFKTTFQDNLNVLIDPDHPDLGPKNNEFAFVWGRLKNGRGDLVQRFVKDGFGSINANGHTTVCQGSLYFTGKAMSEQWDGSKFTGGDKFYWQGDLAGSKFVIFVGANMFESNYGPPLRVPQITNGVVDNGLRYVVVDPRFSKAASKAWKWIPIKPGEDAALALGMIRWIIESQRHNVKFLANANKAAAQQAGEASWTTASWLVKVKDGKPGKFVRASELNLVTKGTDKDKDGKEITVYTTADGARFTFDPFVVLVAGKPVPFEPNSSDKPVVGESLVTIRINDLELKSGLQVIFEASQAKTLSEWAKTADIAEDDIITLAREFTSYGTRAVADIHRGPSQHTNGFYNNLAWYTLNALIGNYDHKGGLVKLTLYDRMGSKAKGPFDIGKLNNGKNTPFGLDILRTATTYEKSTLFSGYPAKRPWFPLATDVYQEDMPSMGDAYPYPVKIAMFYMSAINYSLPAAQTVIEIMSDPKKIPLIITSDIFVGETATYSDYIFPDLTYLEQWAFHGSHPSVTFKVENVRNPALAIPGWPTVKVFGQAIPLSFEALVLAIAEKLNLPGFGPDGLGKGKPFQTPEDLYLKQVANIAFGEKEDGSDAVPAADDHEVDLFLKARTHLPRSVFDVERWKATLGNDDTLWRRVITVMNRGGRYQNAGKEYKGDLVANTYGKQINLYQEKTATSMNSLTGKPFAGYALYIPPGLSGLGEPIQDEGYDFTLLTYKEMQMAKSRGIANYWLLALIPENYVLMNTSDAARLGLKNGDRVKISSASNLEGIWDLKNSTKIPMIGKLKVTQGIRPGVVSFPLGWGHFGAGARDVTIDGTLIKGDPRRATGIHANAAMRIDPALKNVTLTDLVGGSAVFYDTKVKVEKS